MSEPKFHVGQHVAVSGQTPFWFVIPSTVVLERRFFPKGTVARKVNSRRKQVANRDHWFYRVEGLGFWAMEETLRPINPDTEYLSTPSSTNTPISQEMEQ